MNVGGPVTAARTVRGATARRGESGFRRTPVPDPGGDFILHAVSEPFAVGATSGGPLVLAWNGTTWAPEALPERDPALHGAVLTAVRGDVAVGGAFDRLRLAEIPLLLRRSALSEIPVAPRDASVVAWHDDGAPELGFPYVLTGVSGPWAVGHGFPGSVVLRHDGAVWKPVPVPGRPVRPRAVAATSGGLLVAGAHDKEGVILHLDGSAWRQWRTRTGPVTSLALWRGGAWAASGDELLHWNGRRWAHRAAPLRINALSVGHAGLQCAGAGRVAVFDGRRWTVRDLPGTWLGADTDWFVGTA
ncbi:hypothetical protein LO762_06000 [Actinocorallia sp. API 0066]|uniref:hypothetical protein n=1 Tax=Actinocorallia sp. API 0066 TaxID=2896846 RepID=UPI001E3E98C5|nr:hypothetical protein [Actinocorallia sp. API 0066]MCD0448749.1 hypothetical protein [Actinocorallia sp. API 0066]